MTETEAPTRSRATVELHINQNPEGQIDAVAPLRWCLTPELADEVRRESRNHEPMLVIVDRSNRESQGVKRWVVPLTSEMLFLSFSRAGTHRLSAFVATGPKRYIQALALDKSNRHGYHNNLFDEAYTVDDNEWPGLSTRLVEGDTSWDNGTNVTMIGGVAELNVEVPADMFAREPRQWRKNYLNLFFRHKPEDQCHNRKRTLFTLPLLPVIFALSMVIRTVVALGSTVLCGRVNLKPVVKPFSTHLLDPWEEPPTDTKPWKVPGVWLASLAGLGAAAFVLYKVWQYPWTALLVVACIVAVVGVIAAGIWLVEFIRDRRWESNEEYELQEDELASMVCFGNLGGADVALGGLAKNKRTIRLRFANLKSKVCRPYQS